jgi:DNA-binding transcriptional regulator YiaG
VNPAHLEVGASIDNMHDMISRGRARHPAKLDCDAVRAIRAARAEGVSVQQLADKYGVSISAIYKIGQGVRRRAVSF